MFLRWMKNTTGYGWLRDEAGDQGDLGGGGGAGDVTIDIDKAVEEIGAGLGLESDDAAGRSATPSDGDDPDKGQAPAPQDKAKAEAEAKAKAERTAALDAARKALTEKKVDFTGKTEDEILALAKPASKAAPKSWKKELHEHFAKLDPAVQDYILEREGQTEQGFLANKEHVEFGKNLREVITPYQALLTSQGVDAPTAVKHLLNAHYNLSHADEGQRIRTLLAVAKSYKIEPAKAIAAMQAAAASPDGSAETPAERANRERLDRLEAERQAERVAAYNRVKAEAEREVAAFAADPKHIYFSEVQHQVALLMADPSITLAQAYEQAVMANPVTRERELARLRTEAEEKARKEAEEKAAAAAKARGTRVKGDERHRASPDPLGSMDDTLRDTYREIQSRH